MIFADTHAHIFASEFDLDREECIEKAQEKGIQYFFLPNIEADSIEPMILLSRAYPQHCFPLIGIHPSYIKDDFENQLLLIDKWMKKEKFYGIGETGIDLYWDITFKEEQAEAFRYHIQIAEKHKLPLVIHVRNSHDEVIEILKSENKNITGIFHCFTGDVKKANEIIELGFKLGIGGVATFKNSDISQSIKEIDLSHIVLETDSPYLAPAPKRGKRNEPAYLYYIAEKIAEIKQVPIQKIAEITTQNAKDLFQIS